LVFHPIADLSYCPQDWEGNESKQNEETTPIAVKKLYKLQDHLALLENIKIWQGIFLNV
jgi:hypothetical protein